MKKNLVLDGNIQFFADTTFDVIPPQNKGMKLFVMLTFNNKLNKVLLSLLALIYNENRETLEEIFNFLKRNYSFNPAVFTVDFGKAGYLAISHAFPSNRIFPCYFHLIRRLVLHIKNLRAKNKLVKRNAKKFLFNMKILLFIDSEKIDNFFNKIKIRFNSHYKKFLEYFEKQYFLSKPFNDKHWNYSNFLKIDEDTQQYFFTNNVCESLNRTINSFNNFSIKNFYNFSICNCSL